MPKQQLCHQGIIPPYMEPINGLRGTGGQLNESLRLSNNFRATRIKNSLFERKTALSGKDFMRGISKNITVYCAQDEQKLPGVLVLSSTINRCGNSLVKHAFQNAGLAYDFFRSVFHRNSIDGLEMEIRSTVHYGNQFSNAFWNGEQMIYGDGDQETYAPFVRDISVVGHELGHGVIQFTANLAYDNGQSGSLNEHFADVFGILLKQWVKQENINQSNWLIGDQALLPQNGQTFAIRSLASPGTAYLNHPNLGTDPQPNHMNGFVINPESPHINCGIPNRAFYLAAMQNGGFAWQNTGQIWYNALVNELQPNATFTDAAQATFNSARRLYPQLPHVWQFIRRAWEDVGVFF